MPNASSCSRARGLKAAQETVAYLSRRSEKAGVLKVRLYRPFSVQAFVAALPPTVVSLAVLDRTKEPGSAGEPLYLDVVVALPGMTAQPSLHAFVSQDVVWATERVLVP
jgi:pyruvate/2-oxoacid:ferredoxin oxidoreductase alpha subunit